MLNLRQHEALDIKPLNILNDIASHWRKCQLGKNGRKQEDRRYSHPRYRQA